MSFAAVAGSHQLLLPQSLRSSDHIERGTTLTGALFLAAWVLVVVDGIWVYAQLKVIGRKVVPLSLFVAPMLLAASAWAALRRGQVVAPPRTLLPFWLLGCHLIVALLVQTGHGWTDAAPAIHGYYVYYFFLLLMPFQWQLAGTLHERTASTVLLTLGVGLAALATAQHFTGDLFDVGRAVSTEALAFNLSMQGRIRANGLFAHAEDLGGFLSLAGGLALAATVAARRLIARMALLALFVVFAVGCYASYTRSSYLAFAATAFCTVLLHRRGGQSRLAPWYPILFLAVGLGIFFGRSLISGLESLSVLFSSESVEERIYLSSLYWQELWRSGPMAVLFGKGWILFSHPRAVLPIDNNFLAVMLNIGAIGLVFWLWATWRLWLSCLALLRARPSPARVALLAAYSPWLMLSVFGTVSLYQMIALLLVTVSDDGGR